MMGEPWMQPNSADALWQKYIDLENEWLRESALKVLSEFIGVVHRLTPDERKQWVYSICRDAFDSKPPIKIREPLVKEVMLPVLLQAYSESDGKAARWLTYLFQFVGRDLVDAYCRQFTYSVHELPMGVLFGNNGASIDECSELIDDLGPILNR
jgi:hypothetical protein